jgi:hypothetical protein
MASGDAFTVIVVLAVQPLPSEYVMVVVPGAMPVIMPLREPIVALPGALLLHIPPPAPSASIAVRPAHTVPGPDIAVVPVVTFMVAVV